MARHSKEILPVQFLVEIEPGSLDVATSCKYLGTSRATLWRKASKHGIKKNIFGNYNKEDLDKLRMI